MVLLQLTLYVIQVHVVSTKYEKYSLNCEILDENSIFAIDFFYQITFFRAIFFVNAHGHACTGLKCVGSPPGISRCMWFR